MPPPNLSWREPGFGCAWRHGRQISQSHMLEILSPHLSNSLMGSWVLAPALRHCPLPHPLRTAGAGFLRLNSNSPSLPSLRTSSSVVETPQKWSGALHAKGRMGTPRRGWFTVASYLLHMAWVYKVYRLRATGLGFEPAGSLSAPRTDDNDRMRFAIFPRHT